MSKNRWPLVAIAVSIATWGLIPASAQETVYRVKGPLEQFFAANDRDGDTDMLALLLGNRRGENLLEPDTITDLDRIRASSDSFKGVEVLFIGRFHKVGELFNPFYTHFTPDEYVNFSVWGQHARLWEQEGVLSDFPSCYISNRNVKIDRFLSLERLDTVLWTGISRSSLGGEAWIEITGFWQMDGTLNSDHTRDIRRGEDMIAMGDWMGASAIFSRLAESGLPDVYGTFVEKRAAESLLMSGDYLGALRYIKRANAAHGGAEDIAKLYDKIVKANAEGGCEGCPPPRSATQREGGVGGGQVPPSSGGMIMMPATTPSDPPAPDYTPPPPAMGSSTGYSPPPPVAPSAVAVGTAPKTAAPMSSSGTSGSSGSRDTDQEQLDRPGRGY